MLLRIALGFLNRQANDNHEDVVSWIVDKNSIPEKNDCWSCYQPKLYYVVCAALVKLFNVTGDGSRTVVMQQVNVVISFFILLLFWKFIDRQNWNARNKLLLFGLFAFNPCLAGINVQSTNDTPVIFLGMLAAYAAVSFFGEMKFRPAIVLILALVGGALTKASAIVMFGAISAVFIIAIWARPLNRIRMTIVKCFLVLMICFLSIVPIAGGYYHNYKNHGSLTLSTWNNASPPSFFQTTLAGRPGLQNMYQGFFTFRYFDMIRQPYINNEETNYPVHRTSLWSQLYGRTVFMHFDQWPPTWQSQDYRILFIGRVLIILGIIPLGLFLAGLIKGIFSFFKNIVRRRRSYFAIPENYLHLLVTLAFLASSIYYSYSIRDFSSMKSIYIFPGFLSFIKLLGDGFMLLKSKRIISGIEGVLVVIILFSIADIAFLIYQLS